MKILLTALLLICGINLIQSQSFESVTVSYFTTAGTASRSANFVDVNGDGWDDIFVSNGLSSGQNNNLFINNGDGTFTWDTSSDLVLDNSRSVGASFADADNDGDLDAVVVTFGAGGVPKNNFFYRNQGDGNWLHEASDAISQNPSYSEAATWVDIDNNQELDVLVTNSVGQTKNDYFQNQSDGTFEKLDNQSFNSIIGPSRSVDWIDYDNDGDSDLFITNEGTVKNELYRNLGNGNFEAVLDLNIVTETQSSAGSSWGDIDNDGDFDLFIANYSNNGQANELFVNNGNGTFTKNVNSEISIPVTNSFGSSFGDLDNDGDLDLFVCNAYLNSQNRNYLYLNDGDGGFELTENNALSMQEGWTFGCAFADYNHDGWLDVILANTNNENQSNSLFKNTGSGFHSIQLNLISTLSNASALGAKIKATANINGQEVTQTRYVAANSGYCSQNSYTVHFGLGDATDVTELIVEWPSGIVESFSDLEADQINELIEGTGLSTSNEELRKPSEIKVFPNPVRDSFQVIIEDFSPGINYLLKLRSIDGSLIQTEFLLQSENSISIEQLPAGTYFYEFFEDEKLRQTKKLVKF